MRLSVIASLAVLLAATLASGAGAARKPTPSERAAITLAAIDAVPHVGGLAAIFVVRRVIVSTVKPGSSSSFSRFAAAVGVAKDQSGLYPTGPASHSSGSTARRATGSQSATAWAASSVTSPRASSAAAVRRSCETSGFAARSVTPTAI